MTENTCKKIDEAKLGSDLEYRFTYVTEFMGFGEDDIAAIHGSAPLLAPLVDGLVDAVYVQLFKYDCTKRHFVPRQSGYEGEVPTSIDELSLDDEQIAFRKSHLNKYIVKLVSDPYDGKLISYLDTVGRIHTTKAGSKSIQVPLVQMNALMGFVSNALVSTVQGLDVPQETKDKTINAFNKLLWIQNDLITRWYVGD